MHPNKIILTEFYQSFAALNANGMIKYYHHEVSFSDPVFPALNHTMVSGMWQMLCSKADDFKDEFKLEIISIDANNLAGIVEWEATYRFSKTGRMIKNRVSSHFKFNGRLIELQIDHFNLWRWSRMALGLPGILFGWGPLKLMIRKQAKAELSSFLSKK